MLQTTSGLDSRNVVCCHADSSFAHFRHRYLDLAPYYAEPKCLPPEDFHSISLTSAR